MNNQGQQQQGQQQQGQQQQQQQQPAAGAPDASDIQQKQSDIGQASAAPAGTLASYETVARDDGICSNTGKYKNL
jgi:hypothetical protein